MKQKVSSFFKEEQEWKKKAEEKEIRLKVLLTEIDLSCVFNSQAVGSKHYHVNET